MNTTKKADLHVCSSIDKTTVAEELRTIADNIEAGLHGPVSEGVLVINGYRLEIHQLGLEDSGTTHLLLHAAMMKMAMPIATWGEEEDEV